MANANEEPDDLYDLAPAESPQPRQAIPIEDESPKPKLGYAPNKTYAKGNADPETIKNFYMPVWLLGAGVVVEMASAFLREPTTAAALAYVAFEVILGTIVMTAGLFIAAKLRHINLGRFWVAVFKLSAVSVAPSAAASLLYLPLRFIPLGLLLVVALTFILYFALLGALFDLDESDTWYCVWTIFLVRLVLYFALYFSPWWV